MCAWIRACGGASKSYDIYKNGNLEKGLYNQPWKPSYSSHSPLGGGSITNNGTTLTLTSTGSSNAGTSFITEEIDLTNINTVRFKVASYSHPYWDIGVVASNQYANNYNVDVKMNAPAIGINDIDVSAITGLHRLFIFAGGGNGMTLAFDSIECLV